MKDQSQSRKQFPNKVVITVLFPILISLPLLTPYLDLVILLVALVIVIDSDFCWPQVTNDGNVYSWCCSKGR